MSVFSAVVTTGIYCRPGCGARPRMDNVRTFEMAEAAEAAGFRACLRCRPYRVAGTVPWDAPELVCRAVQMIIAGALDEGTEAELGGRLGLSGRHLRRLFQEHLGLTPDQFARSRRAHFARRMLDETDLAIVDVAFAAGFGSLRQFNRIMQEIFRESPVRLRERRRRADRVVADGGLTHRLAVTPPYDWDAMLAFLAARAIPGVEAVEGPVYRRTIVLDGGPGVLEIHPGGADHLLLRAHLPYWEGVIHVVERVRRMLGLDLDRTPALHLAGDQTLAPLVRARPGLRVPGAWGPFEVGVFHAVRQHCDQVQTRAYLGELVRTFGMEIPGLPGGLSHAFPGAEVLADADFDLGFTFDEFGPRDAARSVRNFAQAVVNGKVRLDGSASLEGLVQSLTDACGFTPEAAEHLAMRLGERDAFPDTDPEIRRALYRLDPHATDSRPADMRATDLSGTGLSTTDPSPTNPSATDLGTAAPSATDLRAGDMSAAGMRAAAEPWRPWRALAAMYLMTQGDSSTG